MVISVFSKRIKAKKGEVFENLVSHLRKSKILSNAINRIGRFENRTSKSGAFRKIKRIYRITKFLEHLSLAVKKKLI